jgi:FdrA protein
MLLGEGQSVDQTNADRLLSETLIVIHVGLGKFTKGLEGQGVDMIQVEWVPPACGDKQVIDLLDQLL